jgi:hypothetical protein
MLKYILWFIQVLLPISAQAQEDVQLHVRLRYSDGTAVFDETVVLEGDTLRQAQDDVLRQVQDNACTTDINGLCTWSVPPGLYQLLFTRPLDDLSALALAEGGLDGFGLTVGLSDIVYHFTFHSDSRVYFDAAPESVLPSPIIPEPDDLHSWFTPTPAVTAEAAPPMESTTMPSVGVTTTEGAVTDRRWQPLLFVLFGVGLGGGLYLLQPRLGRVWSRKRPKTADKQPSKNTSEEKEA